MGVVRLTFQMFFYTLVIGLLLIIVPGLPPDYKFEAYSIRPPRRMEGKLTPNDILNKAEIVIEGDIHSPESIAIRGDDVFTGVRGGSIIKVDKNGKWEKVVQLGNANCVNSITTQCARPLGLRFNNEGKLIAIDGSSGLYEIDVDAKTQKQILSVGTSLSDGAPLNFPDDLDIDKDGIIYFSDASKVAKFHNLFVEGFGEPTGRLVQFDPKTKHTEVLIDGLHFANGVQLSKKEDFIVVCESMRQRIWRYYIKGPKRGMKEMMVEGLPGIPDNVRSNVKGGFYVSLVNPDTDEFPNTLRKLLPLPSVKKLILRTQYFLLKGIEMIDYLCPNPITTSAYYYVSHLGPFGNLLNTPRKVIIVDLDENGNIVGSLQNNNGKMGYISEIELGSKYTYFGTPYDNKLWRIKTEYLT